ncbi:hypothetical protein EDD15DRAFT_2202273 [Pisolithus albus]|nr:hypothetical protein EDD15DRAFT_2202273 [Pisolithus albus]
MAGVGTSTSSEDRRSDFSEDFVFEAHASKSGGDWWYGTTVNTGGSRFSLQTCVQLVEPVQVTALNSYEDSSPYKLSFTEGNALSIVDRLESDWWRAEWDGVIYTMLAAYTQLNSATYSTANGTHKLDCVPAIIGVDDDEDDDDYYSLDDDGASDERHGLERRRVLEVVGVIVSEPTDYSLPTLLRTNGYGGVDGVTALGGPAGKGGPSIGDTLPRKQASAGRTSTSARLSPISEILSTSLQPTQLKTTSDSSSTSRVGDAFEHHGTYKKMHGGQSLAANRMSASSFDTTSSLAVSSPPRSRATSSLPSLRDREQERGGESQTVPWDLHNAMTRESSPAFGTSWASLLDRTALEGIPALISTEADYVRDLQLVVELFYLRLVDMLEAESTSVIFSNIEDIPLTHTALLSTLEERQRECRLYIDHVGGLLETHMPHMRVYLDYCVNQANAGKVLQSLRDANPELSTQLQCLREDPSARNLDLFSNLLVPMQHLTRYPLLIRQILQYTDPPTPTPDLSMAPRLTLSLPTEHAERESIVNSLACAERILEEVNETIRDREGRERLGEPSRSYATDSPSRSSKTPQGRCTGESKERAPFLFTNIRIHRAYPWGGETLVLRAPNIREARAWTKAIVLAAAKAKEGIRVAVGDSQDTKVGFGPTAIGVGMGHVASAGSPHATGDLGNGSSDDMARAAFTSAHEFGYSLRGTSRVCAKIKDSLNSLAVQSRDILRTPRTLFCNDEDSSAYDTYVCCGEHPAETFKCFERAREQDEKDAWSKFGKRVITCVCLGNFLSIGLKKGAYSESRQTHASAETGRAGLRSNKPSSVVYTPACPPTREETGAVGGRV